ncbi:T9SS type A sorting domain-containing protein [Hymenobacter sp. AT01-02]|uniref:T9SS type A sorting domain-containing protein n=1 Tax=Hymenobacter sp. AT01-02 TaxID=1571877 RepID=UPI0005F2182C|nr:T9SS type A sorting domain-containing protein [Hymenobacter sp. AT01-02]
MKKPFTLVALGLFAAAVPMHAQTLDGQVQASEGYTRLSQYTSTVRGFGDHGLVALYAKTTATKVYIALTGALETNGNSFQIYLNIPGKTGVASGTALPVSSITGTSFEKAAPIMEMEVDYGFGVKGGATTSASSIIDYTSVTGGKAADQQIGNLPIAGTLVTAPTTLTGGLNKTRMAFLNVNLLTAHTGAQGWEIELDKADLGIADGATLQLFAAQNNGDGGYFSSDVLPEVTGNTSTTNSGNLATNPNFVTLAGTQFITYTATVMATREAVASALKFGVYPNPTAGAAQVSYVVPGGQQEVALEVFNALGQRVRSLAAGKQAGAQLYSFDNLAAGAYFVKLRVGTQFTSQKVVVE